MAVGVANLFAFYLWWPEVSIHGIKKLPVDSLQVARSLGRLDLISFWLTVLGVFLAIMALMGFNFVKSEARSVAEETAERAAYKAFRKSLEAREEIQDLSTRNAAKPGSSDSLDFPPDSHESTQKAGPERGER